MNDRLPQAADHLLTSQEARRAAEFALSCVRADDATLVLDHDRDTTIRFSGNNVAQSMHCDRLTARLRVAFGNRVGSAAVDALDEDSLQGLVRRAEEVARLSPPDPEHLPSLEPQTYAEVDALDDATAAVTDAELTDAARRMIAPVAEAGLTASGTVEAGLSARCLVTRNGLFAFHRATSGAVGCTAASSDASGWSRDASFRLSDLDPGAVAREALATAQRAAAPRSVPAGRYTTVFLPSAVGHLASIPVWLANARRTYEGLTFLSGRDDRKLAADAVTIRSDPADPRLPGCPFDGHGTPRQATVWVDRGEFRQMWWERWTAHEHGVEPVPGPEHLFMDGTDRSLDDLLAGIDRGILVTRIWYVRFVKVDQTLVTGMTRDGTFWIENGRIAGALKSLRFNDSCLGLLQRATALGRTQRCVSPDTGPGYFPPLVVRDWNFVDVTAF